MIMTKLQSLQTYEILILVVN